MRIISEFSAENAKIADWLAERGGFELSLYFRTTTFSKLQVLSAEIFSVAPGERPPLSALLVRAESQTVHPFSGFAGLQLHFAIQARHRTCGPFPFKKGTAAVALKEFGSECGDRRSEPDCLSARRTMVFWPDAGYLRLVNSRI